MIERCAPVAEVGSPKREWKPDSHFPARTLPKMADEDRFEPRNWIEDHPLATWDEYKSAVRLTRRSRSWQDDLLSGNVSVLFFTGGGGRWMGALMEV